MGCSCALFAVLQHSSYTEQPNMVLVQDFIYTAFCLQSCVRGKHPTSSVAAGQASSGPLPLAKQILICNIYCKSLQKHVTIINQTIDRVSLVFPLSQISSVLSSVNNFTVSCSDNRKCLLGMFLIMHTFLYWGAASVVRKCCNKQVFFPLSSLSVLLSVRMETSVLNSVFEKRGQLLSSV